jgi:DNA-binding LytR/AlgR family response regulator
MSIKCLAIDDEPLALKQIGSYIKKTPFLELVALINSGLGALEYVSSNQADLIFVDINMIGYNEFLKAVNKVKTLMDLKTIRSGQVKNVPDHLFVKSDYKLLRIELSDIKYIESMHEYIRIHLENDKPVMTLISLKSIEEQLPADKFMRVHRSFIVNLEKIKIIERNRIVFDNSVYIPVGDQYKDAFQQFVEKNFLV